MYVKCKENIYSLSTKKTMEMILSKTISIYYNYNSLFLHTYLR